MKELCGRENLRAMGRTESQEDSNQCMPPNVCPGFETLCYTLSLWVVMSFPFKIPSNNWKKWFLQLASWSPSNSTFCIFQKTGFRCSYNTVFISVLDVYFSLIIPSHICLPTDCPLKGIDFIIHRYLYVYCVCLHLQYLDQVCSCYLSAW